jgi:hypothetical protein
MLDLMESEGEVPCLATDLHELISTLNDVFGSKKEKFVFIQMTISLVHEQDEFIMYLITNHSLISFMFKYA